MGEILHTLGESRRSKRRLSESITHDQSAIIRCYCSVFTRHGSVWRAPVPLSGKTAGREVGNPGEHSGERSGGYGFSGCRARLWGGAAVCASGRRGQSLPPMGAAAWPYGAFRTTSNGGFALHEAFRGCVAGVSEPHVVQFPPSGGSEAVA